MSQSRNQKRKAAKANRTEYAKHVAAHIRKGILPRFHFATGVGGELERTSAKSPRHKPGLSLRLMSTQTVLTKDHYEDIQAPQEAEAEDGNL